MKRTLLILSSIFALLFTFTSCDKNKSAENLIIGKWSLVGSANTNDEIFEFKGGGSCYMYISGKIFAEGMWSIKKNVLEIRSTKENETENSDDYFEFTNNNNTLLLRDELDEKPHTELKRL